MAIPPRSRKRLHSARSIDARPKKNVFSGKHVAAFALLAIFFCVMWIVFRDTLEFLFEGDTTNECVLNQIAPTGRVSKEGNLNPATISIQNLASFSVDFMWISPAGIETLIDELEPQTKLQIHTFLGHVARIRQRHSKIDLAEVLVRPDHPGVTITNCMVAGNDPVDNPRPTAEPPTSTPDPSSRSTSTRRQPAARRRRTEPEPMHLQTPPALSELTCVKYLVNQVEATRLSAGGGMRPRLVKFSNLNHVPLAMIWIDDGSDFEVSPDSLSV